MSALVASNGQSLSIVVPVYNEESTIVQVLATLSAIAFPVPTEIIVVNDGSTDGTAAALDALAPNERIRIVHAPVNGGKGSAVRLGIAQARGDVVAIQDADLELDPTELVALVQPILSGSTDVVYGSRFLAGRPKAPLSIIAANWLLTALTNLLYGARLTDMETCYKIMRVHVARSLSLQANRFDIEPEITAKLLRNQHRILEMPVRFQPRSRAAGKKIRWRDGLHAVTALVKYRFAP